jgi:serine/threonine protein kinase
MSVEITPEKSSKSCKFVGAGTYGEVYLKKDDPTVVVKNMQLYDEDGDLVESNLREAIFLSTFSKIPEYREFIPTLYNINVKNKKITFEMENCGISLHDWAHKTPYIERMKCFPDIICQIARILIFFKKHKLAHMDFKPANLCIDENNKVRAIDFGFITKEINQENKITIGTHCITDPRLLSEERISLYDNDMFSLGVICLFIISKNYWLDDDDDEKYQNLRNDQELHEYYDIDSLITPNNKDYIELIKYMLSFEDRIKPMELYTHPLLDSVRHKYPIIFSQKLYDAIHSESKEKIVHTESQEQKIPQLDFETLCTIDIRQPSEARYARNRKILLDWMMGVLRCKQGEKYATFVLKLFKRIENTCKDIWINKNFQLVGTSILYIAFITFHNDTVPTDYFSYVTDSAYKQKQVNEMVVRILQKLSFDVFPIVEYCEEFRVFRKKSDFDEWCKISMENCDILEEVKFYKYKKLILGNY